MMKTLSIFLFLALSLAACAPGATDVAAVGGERSLEIAIGSPARAIDVTEFDVTSLTLSVVDLAGGETVLGATWLAADGPKTYPLTARPGSYRLTVTHHGTRGGETTSATEQATFSIVSMKITRVTVTPGGIGQLVVIAPEIPLPTGRRVDINYYNVPAMLSNYNGAIWYPATGNASVTGDAGWLTTDGVSCWDYTKATPLTVISNTASASFVIPVSFTNPTAHFTMVSPLGWDFGCEWNGGNHEIDMTQPGPVISVWVPFTYNVH